MPEPSAQNQPTANVILPLGRVSVAVLLAGAGAYLGFAVLLGNKVLAAVLALGFAVMLGAIVGLVLKARQIRRERERALSRENDLEWQISVLLRNQDVRMAQNAANHAAALNAEIAALQARQKVLESQAQHDGLTGLANRLLLTDRYHLAVERAKRSNVAFALLMVDLNEFKTINDRHGHLMGDAVLVVMANRLLGAVRASDTVARIGGDEFVLLIESVGRREEFAQLGQKLIDTLFEPVMLPDGSKVHSGASVGMAMYPTDGEGLNDLLLVADKTMYECKSSGLMSLY